MAVSSNTTLEEGEATLLACVGYGPEGINVTWYRDGMSEMNSSLISTYQNDIMILGRTFTQTFLELCSVSMEDAGLYTCVVTNGDITMTSSVELNVAGKVFDQCMHSSTRYSR